MIARGEQTLFWTRWQHTSQEPDIVQGCEADKDKKKAAELIRQAEAGSSVRKTPVKQVQNQAKGVKRDPMGVPVGGYQKRKQGAVPDGEPSRVREGRREASLEDRSKALDPVLKGGGPSDTPKGGTGAAKPIRPGPDVRGQGMDRAGEGAYRGGATTRPHLGLTWLWILLFFLALLAVIDYPYVSRVKGIWEREKLIREYDSLEGEMEQRKLREKLMDARGYNEMLFSLGEEAELDPFSKDWSKKSYSDADKSAIAVLKRKYRSLKYLEPSQLMGYVVIPSLGLRFPIERGKGSSQGGFHMEGTSLPVGGSSTHACILGGEGEEIKRIFASLERLNQGDTFFVHILGYTFAYRMLRQTDGKAGEVSPLAIHKNQDLVSLILMDGEKMTCYTGSRIKYSAKEERSLPNLEVFLEDWWWAMVSVFLFIFMILVLQWLYSPVPSGRGSHRGGKR